MDINDEEILFGPHKIWILHPEREEGPQWRRCCIELHLTSIGTLYLHVGIRRQSDGASVHDLYTSYGFIGCLDRVFEDILRSTFQAKIAEKFHEHEGDRQNWLIRASSRGASSPENGKSPSMHFSLPSEVKELFEQASSHEKMRLAAGAAAISKREEGRKSRFVPLQKKH